jgi:hypothetical protein
MEATPLDQYCKSRGFDKDANPVTIVVLLSDIPGAGFLAEAPRILNTYPIRYEAREPCVAHAGAWLSPGDQIGRPGIPQVQQQGVPTEGTLGRLGIVDRQPSQRGYRLGRHVVRRRWCAVLMLLCGTHI